MAFFRKDPHQFFSFTRPIAVAFTQYHVELFPTLCKALYMAPQRKEVVEQKKLSRFNTPRRLSEHNC